MTIQRGRDLLIKYRESDAQNYAVAAGLRTTKLIMNSSLVDVTNLDSAGRWRELLSGAGTRSVRIEGAGIFRDAAIDMKFKNLFFGAEIGDFEITIPDFGKITGNFQIDRLEYTGQYNGELTYNLAFESAGALTFTAI